MDVTYIFKIRAYDELENVSEYVESQIQIDATPPELVNITSEALTSSNKPTWNCVNEVEDVVEYGVTLNSNIEIKQTETSFTSPVELSDGTHSLRVRGRDVVGNWSDYSVSTIVVDTTAPNKPNPSVIARTANQKPTWSWDTSNDVVLYEVRINNGVMFTQTTNSYTPSENLSDGEYTLKIRAKDEVGNYSDFAESI